LDYIRESILLGVISFFALVLDIAFDLLRKNLWYQLRQAANETGIYQQLNPHLLTLETIFWIVFAFFMIGAIIAYLLASHKEEFEEYEKPRYPGGGLI